MTSRPLLAEEEGNSAGRRHRSLMDQGHVRNHKINNHAGDAIVAIRTSGLCMNYFHVCFLQRIPEVF